MKTFKPSTLAMSINGAILSVAALAASPTLAEEESQQVDSSKLEVIEVTARKRVETVKDVPATVTAMSADNIKDYLGAGENVRALAGRVPSLQIESSNGRQSPRFYIRGLGNTDFDVNANQPVSMVLDDIVLENPVLKGVPLFDIQRVEVLNGPQGTLFGRNTTAGIVKIETVAPQFENSGYASTGYGSRDTFFLEGVANFELSDNWATRISLKHQERGAWVDNEARDEKVGGYEELAYRFQLLFDNDSGTRALLKLHGFDQDGDMPQIFYANAIKSGEEGLRSEFDETKISHDSPSGFNMKHNGGSFKFEHDFDALSFTSITGYDSLESFSYADIDGGETDFSGIENQLGKQLWFNVASGDGLNEHYQFTQELRISGETDNFYYQTGVFYFKEDYTVDNKDLDVAGNTTNFYQIDQLTTSEAIFGQVEYTPNDSWAFTLGLRYTWDDKSLDIRSIDLMSGNSTTTFEIDKDDSYANWDVAARYTINNDLTAFARVGNASRGPVTIGRFGFPSEADTETLTSYEIGLKADLFDGNARWNITAYTYDIEDQQLTATGGEANTNSLLNADNTYGAGVETSFEAVITDNLTANVNMSYNKTEIQDSELKAERCSSTPVCNSSDEIANVVDGPFGPVTTVFIDGNPLPRAPEWLANINLAYEYPISAGYLYAQTDWNYRSESNIFLYNSTEFVAEERWIGGLRFGFKNDDGLDVAVVGRNITDKVVVDGALDFLNLTAFVNEPQFWGVEASIGF
ncbi:TonB-dependent receptor [Thalassotalea litorea]|uniref:TonB-dependent receptor n=1 Tax=Thalassotalea litorea TaxID=2020715 RepID=A0A5R9IQI9_9GAMM|nr:TonB-dependent receptor [Thalassotalea litorea]TLU66307.1 TonB-dependent receptor [Thalassotalea litorea]